ncbi:hypothetical protein [Haloparvum sp. AD34]
MNRRKFIIGTTGLISISKGAGAKTPSKSDTTGVPETRELRVFGKDSSQYEIVSSEELIRYENSGSRESGEKSIQQIGKGDRHRFGVNGDVQKIEIKGELSSYFHGDFEDSKKGILKISGTGEYFVSVSSDNKPDMKRQKTGNSETKVDPGKAFVRGKIEGGKHEFKITGQIKSVIVDSAKDLTILKEGVQ